MTRQISAASSVAGPALASSLVLLALALATPSPTAASSIVYVQDHNVWITSPDGSVRHPVTTSGVEPQPYFSPSQADDGTIVAGLGKELYRLDQQGGQIGRTIPTVFTGKPTAIVSAGPFGPRVSPDGRG